MIKIKPILGLLAISAAVLSSSTAYSQIVGRVWQNQVSAAGNATIAQEAALEGLAGPPPNAQFQPTAFNFNSSVGGYTIGGFLNNPSFSNVQGGFDPAQSADNTYYYFTGQITLNAGANKFVVSHDDGLQLNIDGIGLVVNAPGPSSPSSLPFTVTAPSAGTYDFELSYGECCGPPAQLIFDINDVPIGNGNGVPDAGATAGLLGIAAGLVMVLRTRK